MKKLKIRRSIDKNFFREMNYELAGDIGILDNEDMKRNRRLYTGRKKK
ncbi:hypothetical protein [Alkaliphilus serpentinus]|nr:hypothetical protein [Alkaliphilus serpentinus]